MVIFEEYHYGYFLANIKVQPILKIILESVFCYKSYFYFGNFYFFYFFAKTNMRHMHYQRKQMMNSNYQFIMAKVSLPSWANIEFSRTTKSSTVELILRWVLKEIDLIVDCKRWPLVRDNFFVIGVSWDVNYKVCF